MRLLAPLLLLLLAAVCACVCAGTRLAERPQSVPPPPAFRALQVDVLNAAAMDPDANVNPDHAHANGEDEEDGDGEHEGDGDAEGHANAVVHDTAHVDTESETETEAETAVYANANVEAQAQAEQVSAELEANRVLDPVTGLYCDLVGDCHACPVSEKEDAACRDTGYRQELRCPPSGPAIDDNQDEIRFQSCSLAAKANPVLRVLTFEIVMAVTLAIAYALLRKERGKHLSLFDLRKSPRQRGPLLATTTAKDED